MKIKELIAGLIIILAFTSCKNINSNSINGNDIDQSGAYANKLNTAIEEKKNELNKIDSLYPPTAHPTRAKQENMVK